MAGREKAEQVMWNYRRNEIKVAGMREMYGNLMSVRGQDYGAHAVNGVSDPVSEVVHRKLELEKKIGAAKREIEAVEKLKESLPLDEIDTWQMHGILVKRYVEHKKAEMVMRELGITKTTYYRRKNMLVERAMEYV